MLHNFFIKIHYPTDKELNFLKIEKIPKPPPPPPVIIAEQKDSKKEGLSIILIVSVII
jgi:hypothetical protein